MDIPLNAVVEFILIDEGTLSGVVLRNSNLHFFKYIKNTLIQIEDHFTGLSHPFHLHGHYYYVMNTARAEDFGVEKMTVDIAKRLHIRGLIKSLVVVRIIAANPGNYFYSN